MTTLLDKINAFYENGNYEKHQNMRVLVSRIGFEPMTPSLKGKCSTNWANGPMKCINIFFLTFFNCKICNNEKNLDYINVFVIKFIKTISFDCCPDFFHQLLVKKYIIYLIAVLILVAPAFLASNTNTKVLFKNFAIWGIIVLVIIFFKSL